MQDEYGAGAAAAKVEILKHVLTEIGDSWECFDLIDAAQRLGIDYHFQEEIEALMQKQYIALNADQFHPNIDLHKASLIFRLFRQQAYLVSAGTCHSLPFN